MTRIGESAFFGCGQLKSANIPYSVTKIESNTFNSCYNLTEITLPSNLKEIGSNAFYFCQCLKSVAIPDSVETIGANTFTLCDNLAELTIPKIFGTGVSYLFGALSRDDNVTYIPLEKVTIKSADIPDYAFFNAKNLRAVSANNASAIGASAFYQCYSLETLDSLAIEDLGDEAFYDCRALSSVNLSDNIENIPRYAFAGCSSLTSITLPSELKSIGGYAFQQCTNLSVVNFGNQIETIGSGAFLQCENLLTVTFPDGLQQIDDYAYQYCRSLTSVELPSTVNTVGRGVFNGCDNLTYISLPEVYGASDSTNFYFSYIFGGNGIWDNTPDGNCIPNSLTRVKIDATIIPASAFSGCKKITTIEIPNAVNIESEAFYDCSSLENLVLPEGLTSIGESAFASCSSITQIDLPSTLTSIGESAFSNSYLTSITIPSSVASVGRGAFSGCESLNEITLPKIYGNGEYGYNCFNYLFGGYSEYDSSYVPQSLKKVTISVNEISPYAFYQCNYIKEINVENATSIGYSAFSYCNALRTLTLPSSLLHIDDNAFSSCFKLYEIYNLSPLTLEIGSTENGLVAYYAQVIHTSQEEEPIQTMLTDELVELICVNDEYIATMYTGSETSLTLGDLHYNGLTVVNYSLAQGIINDTGVSSLVIGPQVTALSNNCFENNYDLQTVDVSKATIQTIPDNCFYNCNSLYDVSMPNITEIRQYAFNSCRSLSTISLPDNVTIGWGAFAYCSNLQSIAIPVGATIGENAFIGCKNLLEVYNLAGLDLNDCSLGYNAVKVYDSLSEPSVVQRVTDSQGFKYAICDGQAYLYGFEYISSDEPIYYYLYDNFVYNNITYPYVVCPYAFESVGYNYNLVLPKTLKFRYEENSYISNCPNVYYQGTEEEWSEDFGYSSYWWNSLSFKADCVHDYGNWMERNGLIITSPEFTYRVIKEATCSEEGIQERECVYCGEKTRTSIPKSNTSHNVVDGKCTDCGVSVVRITQENIMDYFDVSYDAAYPFELQGDTFVSTNTGCPSSESRVTLTAKRSFNVSFLYYIWSEDSCDVLSVDSLGSTLAGMSGYYIADGEPITVCLDVGYTLTFRYTKDASMDVGEDVAKILEFTIYERS